MLLFSIMVAESPPVWKRAVHPVRLTVHVFCDSLAIFVHVLLSRLVLRVGCGILLC